MRTATKRVCALMMIVAVSASACSDSTSKERCLRSGRALVCGALDGALRAEGLEPGSTVTVTMPETGSMQLVVGSDGRLAGSAGLTSAAPGTGPVEVSIAATARDGTDLSGVLILSR